MFLDHCHLLRPDYEQIHPGDGLAYWAVDRRALARGRGIRTGLEDTTILPDRRMASGNGKLVAVVRPQPGVDATNEEARNEMRGLRDDYPGPSRVLLKIPHNEDGVALRT